jgi:hypothetical protein
LASDGIKFLIDLDSKVAGANAAENALNRVDDAAQKASRSVGEHSGKFDMMTSSVFKAELATKALEKGWEMATEAVHKAYEIIKDTVQEVAGGQRDKMVMTNLLGGEDEANKALHYLDRFSELSEFSEKRVRSMGIQLAKAGMQGQEWRDALAGIADAASLSADKMEGADAAMSSMMRMKMTGKIDARVLRGLGLNEKDVIGHMADALGMTPKAVDKALTEGAIPAAKVFNTVLEAIERKTGKKLSEAGLSMGQGLDAKMTHWEDIPGKLMRSVADSPGIKAIEGAFDKMIEHLDPDSEAGQKVIGRLGDALGAVGNVLDNINWEEAATRISDIATSSLAWVDPLSKIASLLLKIGEGLAALPTLGMDLGNAAGDVRMNLQRNSFEGDMANRKGKVKSVFTDVGEGSRESTFAREAKAEQIAKFDKENAAAWADIDLSKAKKPSSTGVHIDGAVAHVQVNVGSSKSTPEEIGHAVKAGAQEGITKAVEQQAIQAGLRVGK